MKRTYLLFCIALVLVLPTLKAQTTLSGELKQWHKVTLTFESGINLSETSVPNPFADYRLNVTFTKGAKTYVVPGYFAGDGNAANTSAVSGSKWRVHFSPDETGVWNYTVSFRTGSYIAVSDVVVAGAPVAPLNGLAGTFTVQASNKTGNDFRGKGRLQYVGKHHLQFAGNGKYFVKGGSYCPENFLAYYEFDGTYDVGGTATTLLNGLHQYPDHLQDWHTGDPTWQNGKGKSIIGALNYLASNGMNALGFIVMNQKGDGDDVWPYISHNVTDRERFDLSKLDQWEILFTHMDSLGLALHIVLSERENQMVLDNGEVGTQRRLFYRELIARYSHHLGIFWDLGEENGREFLNRGFQSDQQRKDMATYFKTHDPYKSFVCLNAYENVPIYRPLLGYPDFDGTSQQDYYHGVHNFTVQWRDSSALKGRKWVIFHDETRGGITVDGTGNNHFQMRKSVLWGNLMGGGGGVEWYFGADDLNVETFRTRANVWAFTKHAINFFHTYLPFEDMRNLNSVTSSSSDYVLALPGKVYAVYIPNSSSTNITLPCGTYSVKWYDPKTGGGLLNGSVTTVNSGTVSLGTPPYANEDWVILVTNNFNITFEVIHNGGCNSALAVARAIPMGGVAPYTYQWSNGTTSQSALNLSPGVYSLTVTGANGCSTSGQVTVSSQVQATVTNVNVTICNGGQHFAGGAWRTQSGTYYDTLNGSGNCDSIVVTSLTVRTPIVTNVAVSVCNGGRYFAGGAWRTQSGTYYDTLVSSAGCDSVVATALTVRAPITRNVIVQICSGQSYFAGGAWRTTSGFYRDTLTSAAGCDSIVLTALGVANVLTSQRQLNICTGDSILLGGSYRKVSGTYRDTLNTTAGCDSVVTTNLTVTFCNPCTVFDCNGVCNGAAFTDQCGICVGGNTGRTACTDCALRVNSLTLMYEGTLGPVTTMTNNMVISRDTLCRFNIRANVCQQSTVGSVKFILNGATFRNESAAPYAIFGDNNGSYNPWIPAPGAYTLKVVPYSGAGGTGTAGTFVTINFTVINPSGGTPAACTATPARDCNGVINGTAFRDDCGVCSGGTTGHVANSDKDNCGVCFGNNSTCCTSAAQCNDNNACTSNACVNGTCVYTPIVCNDNNGCTNDACVNGVCQFTARICNDNLACTNDACVNHQCQHTPIPGQSCCTSNASCNDNNACTNDICTNGQCSYQPIASQPPYLKVVNPERSWRKLKFGYSATNIWSPKLDVTATGNHTLCITLRAATGTTPDWSKIQVRPQASASNQVTLGNYVPAGGIGNTWTTICIPLSAFNGFNFTQISYFEFPFSNGANAFEIHIQKMEFTGGTTPFLWFGNNKTDNYHDGQTGNNGALIAQLMPGQSCGSKLDGEEVFTEQSEPFINAFPNPVSDKLHIEFMLAEDETVELEIYNLTGQLLATIYKGDVKAGELIRAEYNAADLPSGVVIYRLNSAKAVQYGKVVVER